jgi:hypothetical protein
MGRRKKIPAPHMHGPDLRCVPECPACQEHKERLDKQNEYYRRRYAEARVEREWNKEKKNVLKVLGLLGITKEDIAKLAVEKKGTMIL